MKKKVIISSDSTCDLSRELVEKYDVKIFPLNIVRDTETLLDGVELSLYDVFDYKNKTGKLLKTSAPSVGQLEEHINTLVKDVDIVHFSISGEFSSAYNNMRLVSDENPSVYPIDSRNLSTGIGLQVLKACELRDEGKSAAEITEYITEMSARVDASFVLDTLEYLYKGGRCSGVAALGANLLKLKPCIEVVEGKMTVGKKYRGKLADVLLSYVDDRLSDIDNIEHDRIFVTSTMLEQHHDLVELVINKLKNEYSFKEIIETQAGCTVGAHCGPDTLGILFVRKSPLKA